MKMVIMMFINVSLKTMYVQQEQNVVILLMNGDAKILLLLIQIKNVILTMEFVKKYINLASFIIQKLQMKIKMKLIAKPLKNIMKMEKLIIVIYVFLIKIKLAKKQKLTKCEDYESWMDENHCNYIPSNYKHCTFENKKCVKVYNDCPETNEEISKENCEAIKLWDYYICKYDENNKNCYMKIKDCSDGANEEKFKKIVPYDESKGTEDYKNRCVWESQSCVKKPKVCGDAKDSNECSQITPASANKNCTYINGE